METMDTPLETIYKIFEFDDIETQMKNRKAAEANAKPQQR